MGSDPKQNFDQLEINEYNIALITCNERFYDAKKSSFYHVPST